MTDCKTEIVTPVASVTVTRSLDNTTLADMMTDFIESGEADWVQFTAIEAYPGWYADASYYVGRDMWATAHVDVTNDGEETEVKAFGPEQLQNGWLLLWENDSDCATRILDGDYDVLDVDTLLQYSILGEITFG